MDQIFYRITSVMLAISGTGLIVYSLFIHGHQGWIMWGIGMILNGLSVIISKIK